VVGGFVGNPRDGLRWSCIYGRALWRVDRLPPHPRAPARRRRASRIVANQPFSIWHNDCLGRVPEFNSSAFCVCWTAGDGVSAASRVRGSAGVRLCTAAIGKSYRGVGGRFSITAPSRSRVRGRCERMVIERAWRLTRDVHCATTRPNVRKSSMALAAGVSDPSDLIAALRDSDMPMYTFKEPRRSGETVQTNVRAPRAYYRGSGRAHVRVQKDRCCGYWRAAPRRMYFHNGFVHVDDAVDFTT